MSAYREVLVSVDTLVEEALNRGAERVYAGVRQPMAHPDNRVVPVILDVTKIKQVLAAAAVIESLDVLVNNAGVGVYDDLTDRDALHRHLEVNLFGTYDVTQSLLPPLVRSRGAVVNVLSIAALAALPILPAYSISKGAAFSLSQSLRALLASKGVTVHAVLSGPVDTDMTSELHIPKASPNSVATAIFDGVDNGDEEIFPDAMSRSIEEAWRSGSVKAMEHEFAAFV